MLNVDLRTALTKDGYSGGRARAYTKCEQLLLEFDGDKIKARKKLIALCKIDPDLMTSVADFCVRAVALETESQSSSQIRDASNSHSPVAATLRTPCEAKSASTPKNGNVHANAADNGHPSRANSVPPKPQIDTAEAKALRRAANSAAMAQMSVFDKYKSPDGRSIGDCSYGELRRLKVQHTRYAIMLHAIEQHGTPVDHTMKVRDLISEKEMKRIYEEVETNPFTVIVGKNGYLAERTSLLEGRKS